MNIFRPKRTCPKRLLLLRAVHILPVSSVLLLSLLGTSSSAQYITTIAGNGYNGYTGDGGPATCAGTPSTAGICVDVKGNFYLTCVNAIRKVDATTGIITTLAGSTNWGYGGDGGPATAALMQFPISVCLDGAANVTTAPPIPIIVCPIKTRLFVRLLLIHQVALQLPYNRIR